MNLLWYWSAKKAKMHGPAIECRKENAFIVTVAFCLPAPTHFH